MAYADPARQREWKRQDYAKNCQRYCAAKRERYAQNPGPFLEASKRYRLKNIDDRRQKDSEYRKAYYAKNSSAIKRRTVAYERARYATDWQYAESRRLRCRVREAFRRAMVAKTEATMALVGCTPGELCRHIASQLRDGMTAENRHLWHLDHIFPLCAADLRDPRQARAVNNWRNLRPMWKRDNLRKGGSVTQEATVLFQSILDLMNHDSETLICNRVN